MVESFNQNKRAEGMYALFDQHQYQICGRLTVQNVELIA